MEFLSIHDQKKAIKNVINNQYICKKRSLGQKGDETGPTAYTIKKRGYENTFPIAFDSHWNGTSLSRLKHIDIMWREKLISELQDSSLGAGVLGTSQR